MGGIGAPPKIIHTVVVQWGKNEEETKNGRIHTSPDVNDKCPIDRRHVYPLSRDVLDLKTTVVGCLEKLGVCVYGEKKTSRKEASQVTNVAYESEKSGIVMWTYALIRIVRVARDRGIFHDLAR